MTRNQTTWTNVNSTWCHGKTKVIRVPEALASQILEYARDLDALSPNNPQENIPNRVGDVFQWQQITLKAIATYIEWKRQNYHPNQNSKQLDTSTRAWDELRKFKSLVENDPQRIINSDSS